MILQIKYDWQAEFNLLDGAYAPATIRSYFTDLAIFECWCDDQGRTFLPAAAETVCAFLEDQAPALAPSTVRWHLYAIRKAYLLLDLADPTIAEDINLTIRRVRRQKPGCPRQAKGGDTVLSRCLPGGAAQHGLGPAQPGNAGPRLCRRSELVALTPGDLAWRDDGTLRVLIRRSKADPFGHGRVSFTSRATANLVANWLDWRGEGFSYLFCPIYQGEPINRSLSASTVKELIKDGAERAGLEPDEVLEFSGHSLRVGATQDLLCASHDTAAIIRAGGWKSVNVLGRYLELAEHNAWA